MKAAILLIASKDRDIAALRFLLSEAQALNWRISQEASEAQTEPTLTWEKQPLYLSEEGEDLRWQLDNELIDLKTYEALMKELDFQNSEVAFDEPYESFHY